MARKLKDPNYHWVLDANGKKHYVMKGTDPSTLAVSRKGTKYPYSTVTRNLILSKVAEGHAIAEIGRMEGFPPATTIWQWVRNHADFKIQIMNSRQIRGFVMEEKALQAAEEADVENVQVKKLQSDVYRWSAEVSNPEVYGKRTKVVGDPNQPVSFIIDTGIRRTPIECEPITEVPSVVLPAQEGA